MSKSIPFLFCLMISIAANAQITVSNAPVQERAAVKPAVFDSLSNLTKQKTAIAYKQYLGYKLFCLPISTAWTEPQGKQKSKYPQQYPVTLYSNTQTTITEPHTPFEQTALARNFSALERKSAMYKQEKEKYENKYIHQTQVYRPQQDKNVIGGIGYCTNLTDLYGTYFTILDIQATKNRPQGLNGYQSLDNADNGFLNLKFTLASEATSDTVFWLTTSDELENANWLLVPYFEKQLQRKGQTIIAQIQIDDLIDINTGSTVNISPLEEWYCYDVTCLNSADYRFVKPYYLIQKDGHQLKLPFGAFGAHWGTNQNMPMFLTQADYQKKLLAEQQAEHERLQAEQEQQRQAQLAQQELEKMMIEKWGAKYGKLIADGQVTINMTKEMCIDAWGEPLYINNIILKGLHHEQWVYGYGTYLYFDNNKLTAIQN